MYYYHIVESAPIDLQSPPPGWKAGRLGPSHIYAPSVLNRAWHRGDTSKGSLDHTDRGRDFPSRALHGAEVNCHTGLMPGTIVLEIQHLGPKVDLTVKGRKASTRFLITP